MSRFCTMNSKRRCVLGKEGDMPSARCGINEATRRCRKSRSPASKQKSPSKKKSFSPVRITTTTEYAPEVKRWINAFNRAKIPFEWDAEKYIAQLVDGKCTLDEFRMVICNTSLSSRNKFLTACGYMGEDYLFTLLPAVPQVKPFIKKWLARMTPLPKDNQQNVYDNRLLIRTDFNDFKLYRADIDILYKSIMGKDITDEPDSVVRCLIVGNCIANLYLSNGRKEVTMSAIEDVVKMSQMVGGPTLQLLPPLEPLRIMWTPLVSAKLKSRLGYRS